MNYQISNKEKITLEKNFSDKKFNLVESNIISLIKKGCSQNWLINVLAVSYAKQKKFLKAELTFLKLIKLEPNDFDNYFNIANLYRETKKYTKCLEYLFLAIKIQPNNIKALTLISSISFKIKNYQISLYYTNLILESDPSNIEALNIKSVTLLSIGKFRDALKSFKRIAKLEGFKPEYLSDIAVCYIYLGELDKEMEYIKLSESNESAKYNKGIIQLTNGNYKDGWDNYELGLKNKTRILKKGFEKFQILPEWKPCLHKKSVLLIGEQGLGDEIMFSTIIGSLKNKVEEVFIYCDQRIKTILKHKYPFIKFMTLEDENFKKIQSRIPIGSLPKYFRRYEKDFLHNKKPNSQDSKNSKLSNNNRIDKKIIGLSWNTTNQKFGPERNIKLEDFMEILSDHNLRFLNLQYGNHENDINNIEKKLKRKIFINDNVDNKYDLQGLSKKIMDCDVILTIDNSTVHLSGFMNKKCFLMLPFTSDWRWQKNRKDTPWYPSVKIFRQTIKNDWRPVLKDAHRSIINSNF